MIPAIVLFASVLLFRLAPAIAGGSMESAIAGISPLFAFALCGGLFLPRKWAVPMSIALVLIPHVAINLAKGFSVFHAAGLVVALVAAVAAVAGAVIKHKASVVKVAGLSLTTTVLFYLLSNTVSFFKDPGYTRTLGGWLQAMTTGLPEYQPQTWVFGLRQLTADLVFSVCFFLAMRPLQHRPASLPAATPAVSL